MPVVMPPISSTGVMIGSTAWNLKYLSAANRSDQADDSTVSLRRQAGLRTSSHSDSGHADHDREFRRAP